MTQLTVDLIEWHRTKGIEILRLEPEPRCWRTFNSVNGMQSLRPDLFVALGVGDFEHHWFIEVDLGTETLQRRITKCKQYQAYYRTGHEQADQGLFPKVCWILPNSMLATQLQDAISRTKGLTDNLFETTTHYDALEHLAGGTS